MAGWQEDLDRLEGALERAFPDLADVGPLAVLGEGLGSVADETAGGIVFRIGKNAQATEGYILEERLLPALRPRLPVAVPNLQWRQPRSEQFPFGLVGYAKLPGRPLRPQLRRRGDQGRVAIGIARFVYALASLGASGPPCGSAMRRISKSRWASCAGPRCSMSARTSVWCLGVYSMM